MAKEIRTETHPLGGTIHFLQLTSGTIVSVLGPDFAGKEAGHFDYEIHQRTPDFEVIAMTEQRADDEAGVQVILDALGDTA